MSSLANLDRQEEIEHFRKQMILAFIEQGCDSASGIILKVTELEGFLFQESVNGTTDETVKDKGIKTAGVSKGSYIYVDGFRIQLLEDTAIELDQEVVDRFLKEESDRWRIVVWKNKVCCPTHPYGKENFEELGGEHGGMTKDHLAKLIEEDRANAQAALKVIYQFQHLTVDELIQQMAKMAYGDANITGSSLK